MIIHLLWFGLTFSPLSSTCTIGEAENKVENLGTVHMAAGADSLMEFGTKNENSGVWNSLYSVKFLSPFTRTTNQNQLRDYKPAQRLQHPSEAWKDSLCYWYRHQNPRLTSQNFKNKVHIRCQLLNPFHVGNCPYWNKLITVHLRHQVEILWKILSKKI